MAFRMKFAKMHGAERTYCHHAGKANASCCTKPTQWVRRVSAEGYIRLTGFGKHEDCVESHEAHPGLAEIIRE